MPASDHAQDEAGDVIMLAGPAGEGVNGCHDVLQGTFRAFPGTDLQRAQQARLAKFLVDFVDRFHQAVRENQQKVSRSEGVNSARIAHVGVHPERQIADFQSLYISG